MLLGKEETKVCSNGSTLRRWPKINKKKLEHGAELEAQSLTSDGLATMARDNGSRASMYRTKKQFRRGRREIRRIAVDGPAS